MKIQDDRGEQHMLVLWSGGCDSTHVLYNLVKERKHNIRTLTINHFQLAEGQIAKQLEARVAILKWFQEEMEVIIQHNEIKIEHTVGTSEVNQNGGCIQPLIWIPTAAPFLMPDEDLCAGYCRGDDIWHYMSDIRCMFSHFQLLTYKTGKLLFPLEWTGKQTIITDLKRYGLYDLTWYCERPEGTLENFGRCGRCPPCMTHRMALLELEHADKVVAVKSADNKEIKEKDTPSQPDKHPEPTPCSPESDKSPVTCTESSAPQQKT